MRPRANGPSRPTPKLPQTPVVREKPFLMVDEHGNWSVRVPSLRTDSVGTTWRNGATPGRSISLSRFYIAHAGTDTAATINAQLNAGKHLLLTPGIYDLSEPIRVTRAGTVVLGLGFATLKPVNGTAAVTTADADGIILAGLLIDAGETKSPVLMEVGPEGSKAGHAQNPISLHDVFVRRGRSGRGARRA